MNVLPLISPKRPGANPELPCDPDHNGECLVCDCWLSDCEWKSMWAGNFKHKTLEEMIETFKDHLSKEQKEFLRKK